MLVIRGVISRHLVNRVNTNDAVTRRLLIKHAGFDCATMSIRGNMELLMLNIFVIGSLLRWLGGRPSHIRNPNPSWPAVCVAPNFGMRGNRWESRTVAYHHAQ